MSPIRNRLEQWRKERDASLSAGEAGHADGDIGLRNPPLPIRIAPPNSIGIDAKEDAFSGQETINQNSEFEYERDTDVLERLMLPGDAAMFNKYDAL